MASKICIKCERPLSQSDFYRHPAMADGYLNKCKECCKQEALKNRWLNIERYRAYDRERASLPHRALAREEYRTTDLGRAAHAKAVRKWQVNNRLARAAHHILNNALRDGKVKRGAHCEMCKLKTVHAHHEDYGKPLEVRWLCPKHHKEVHRTGESL